MYIKVFLVMSGLNLIMYRDQSWVFIGRTDAEAETTSC